MPTFVIPNSYGTVRTREFNSCHAPNSGEFCSGAGTLKVGEGAPPKDKPITLVFGGSFNPPHAGHVKAADDAADLLRKAGYTVKSVVVVPSPDSLLKAKLGDDALSIDEREELARLQFEGKTGVRVSGDSAREAAKITGKLKRTQVADWAKREHPGTTVVNVTGEDAAPGHPPGFPSIYQGDKGTSHEGYFYLAVTRDTSDSGISSSKVRNALKAGDDVPAGFMTPKASAYLRSLNRFRKVREFNSCHAPNSGQFCSGGGSFSWSSIKPAPGETRDARAARVQRGASNPWGLEKLRIHTPTFDASDQTTQHVLTFKNGTIELVHNAAPGGDPSRLIVQRIDIDARTRGRGEGQKLMLAARDYAKSLGLKGLVSYKTERSGDADRVWDALRRKGHTTRRVPSTRKMLSGYKSTQVEIFEARYGRRLRENQKKLAKQFGIEVFDFPSPESSIRHIGFAPKTKKWYGWSHRAVAGFTVGSTVKKGDVIAPDPEYPPLRGESLPIGFTAKTLDDAKRMASAFALAVS